MANYFARKAGNINAADVWATTPSGTASDVWSTFTSADVLHSNNFAITVNVDTTVGEVRNDNANSATAGGSFTLANGVTLTADAFAGSTVTACVIFSGTAGNSATLVGNPTGGTVTNAIGCNNASTGTLIVTGNPTGGSGGVGATGCNNASTGTLTVTGNPTGGSGQNAHGCNNNSTGTLTVTGNPTGGSGGFAYGCNNNSTGTMTIVGTINASEFNEGVGGGNRSQVTLLTGPFISSSTFGVSPIACKSWRWAESLNDQTYITVPTSDLLATRNLVTPDNATNFPDEADVKDGVSYGLGGALTGTYEQTVSPDPADIATAVWSAATRTITEGGITAADVWSHATRTITGGTVDTLTNAPTVPSASAIASQVRTELTPELTKVSALNTDRLANCATTQIVGTLLAQSQS